jgi:outer membrane biosynthesis protein TonB
VLPTSRPSPTERASGARRRQRRSAALRFLTISSALVAALLFVRAEVTAEEPAPEGGLVPAPAGTDLETLRKLLGLPSRAGQEPAAATPPAAAPATTPEPAQAAPAAPKAPPKKAVAKPPARKPARPVVQAPKPDKPAATAPAAVVEPQPVAEAPVVEAPVDEPVAKDSDASSEPGSPQDVPPAGTVIALDNMERWKHVLGPSIQWAVSRGAKLDVVAKTDAPMEPFREEATKRYSAQVELSPDGNSMRNYVAGIPFPFVDENDPHVAIKMMFNFENRIAVDDVDVRNFACDTGRIPPKKGIEIERHYEVEHFRRIFYTGRFHVDPKPTWPTPDGIRYREMLGALQEPFDLKGAGFTYIRYLDPKRPDDSWLYFPQFKRVRRLSSAQRSEGVFGQDVDLDSYAGYAGNPAWSDWKYLGKKTVLGVLHSRHMPAKYQDAPADFIQDDDWEPREVYILLAVSRLGGYNFGQRVIYLDRESLLIPYTEIYDLKGALWKSLVQTWSFGRKPIPSATRAVYDYEQFYIPSLSMIDIQMNHVTRCSLPAREGEEGWYWNFGEEEGTTEDQFTVAHFIEAGR